MAKGLTKLKSVLKRWQSIGKNHNQLGRPAGNSIAAVSAIPSDDEHSEISAAGFQAVYVGKSRRRYLIRPDVIDHPLVRELVERSGGSEEEVATVGCEVVLFEHLLWMLENAEATHPESLEELVDFYTC